jgi:hypothetical protein
MKTSTKIAIGIFGVGLVAIGVNAIWEGERPGTIVLFAPPDTPARVRIDDGEPIELPAGSVRRLEAEHGPHVVRVEAPTPLERVVHVESGRQHRGVATLGEQCFAELDVTLSHYGESAGTRPPGVNQVERHTEVWEVPSTFHLTEDELPDHTTDTVNGDGEYTNVQLVQLYRSVPCEAADAGDPAVLAALGY